MAIEVQVHVDASVVVHHQHPGHVRHVHAFEGEKEGQILRIFLFHKNDQIGVVIHAELVVRIHLSVVRWWDDTITTICECIE